MKVAITRAKMMHIFPEPLPTISYPFRCPSPNFRGSSKLKFLTRKPRAAEQYKSLGAYTIKSATTLAS